MYQTKFHIKMTKNDQNYTVNMIMKYQEQFVNISKKGVNWIENWDEKLCKIEKIMQNP